MHNFFSWQIAQYFKARTVFLRQILCSLLNLIENFAEKLVMFTGPKLPRKFDNWPISALYMLMYCSGIEDRMLMFLMFCIKWVLVTSFHIWVFRLKTIANNFLEETQMRMAHLIPMLRIQWQSKVWKSKNFKKLLIVICLLFIRNQILFSHRKPYNF